MTRGSNGSMRAFSKLESSSIDDSKAAPKARGSPRSLTKPTSIA